MRASLGAAGLNWAARVTDGLSLDESGPVQNSLGPAVSGDDPARWVGLLGGYQVEPCADSRSLVSCLLNFGPLILPSPHRPSSPALSRTCFSSSASPPVQHGACQKAVRLDRDSFLGL